MINDKQNNVAESHRLRPNVIQMSLKYGYFKINTMICAFVHIADFFYYDKDNSSQGKYISLQLNINTTCC